MTTTRIQHPSITLPNITLYSRASSAREAGSSSPSPGSGSGTGTYSDPAHSPSRSRSCTTCSRWGSRFAGLCRPGVTGTNPSPQSISTVSVSLSWRPGGICQVSEMVPFRNLLTCALRSTTKKVAAKINPSLIYSTVCGVLKSAWVLRE